MGKLRTSCAALGEEVPGHLQEQWTQTSSLGAPWSQAYLVGCKGVLVDAAMGVTSARVSGFAVRRGRGHGRLTVRGFRGPDSDRDPQLHRQLLTRDSTSQELTS